MSDSSTQQVHDASFVKGINAIVRASFGWGFRGDGNFCLQGDTFKEISNSRDNTAIGYVVRPISYGIGEHVSVVGGFTSPDGSQLKVRERFRDRAQKYVEMYQALTGNVEKALQVHDISFVKGINALVRASRCNRKLGDIIRVVEIPHFMTFSKQFKGQFTSPDGSSLSILNKRFRPSAERYAEMYKALTGKEVDIIPYNDKSL